MKKSIRLFLILLMVILIPTIVYGKNIDFRKQWAEENKEFKLIEKHREIRHAPNNSSEKFIIYIDEVLTVSEPLKDIKDLNHIKVITTGGNIGYVSLEELYNFFEGQSDSWTLKFNRNWQVKMGELYTNVVIGAAIIWLILLVTNKILDKLLFKLPWIPNVTTRCIHSLIIKLMPGWLFGLIYTICYMINSTEHEPFMYIGFNILPKGYTHPINWVMYLGVWFCSIIGVVVIIDNFMSLGALAGTFKFIQLVYLNIGCIFVAMIGSFIAAVVVTVYIFFSIISNITYVEVRR